MFSQKIFILMLATVAKSEKNDVPISKAHISLFLKNLTNCDLQIVHDGIDLADHQIPVKLTHVSLNLKLNESTYPALNTLMSRTVLPQLIFLLSKYLINSNSDHKFPKSSPNLEQWIDIAVSKHKYHLYRKENIDASGRTFEKKFFHYGNDAFVILISTRGKRELKSFVVEKPELHNTYILAQSYLADDNYTNGLCAVPQTSRNSSRCSQITHWNDRIATIASWPSVWCVKIPASLYDLVKNTAQLNMDNVNLFDRKENYTIADWARAALSKVHDLTTLHQNCFSETIPLLEFNYKLGSENYQNLEHGMPVITRCTGFQFFTCYREQYISFKICIAPFQPNLWLGLITTLVAVVASASIYKPFGGYAKVSFSAWLFILATIFEETGHMPSKIQRATYLRLILCSWCVMSIFLTNCYNGLMISELNAPLPSFEPKTFQELVCHKLTLESTDRFFYASDLPHVSDSKTANDRKLINDLTGWYGTALISPFVIKTGKNPYRRDDCFSLLSMRSKERTMSGNPEFLDYVLTRFEDMLSGWSESSFVSKYYNLLLSLYLPIHSHHPKNMTYSKFNTNLAELKKKIETEMIKCEKTVYIAHSDVVDAAYVFLSKNYPWRKFYKGVGHILDASSYGVAFRNAVSQRFQCILNLS
ncbi:hypothetical protein Fcan01_11546 [Folsomia candida]|uniref:Uncharacterized protein n=1 Tax=Folsomia candida TaxID=158441 RepID=A0A226E8T5_FOLCA|nr:hypothetical protein Fcan01_11546 [Folsomia candida]